jgi:hypothetical protein
VRAPAGTRAPSQHFDRPHFTRASRQCAESGSCAANAGRIRLCAHAERNGAGAEQEQRAGQTCPTEGLAPGSNTPCKPHCPRSPRKGVNGRHQLLLIILPHGRIFGRLLTKVNSLSPLVRDGQTIAHRPRLVVSRSTCPPISPPPCKQLCTRSCSNKHTHSHCCCRYGEAPAAAASWRAHDGRLQRGTACPLLYRYRLSHTHTARSIACPLPTLLSARPYGSPQLQFQVQ